MWEANVFVDHFPDAPAAVDKQTEGIFGRNNWTSSYHGVIEQLARQFCEESRELAKQCAGENEWRFLLLGLLKPLHRLAPDILMLTASEKREFTSSSLHALPCEH